MYYEYILLVAALLYIYKIFRTRRLPPGPPSLPLIGCLPWVFRKPLHESATELDRRSGEPGLVTFDFGMRSVIVINHHSVIREAFVDRADVMSERPPYLPIEHMTNPHEYGIIIAPGDRWVKARQISLRILRDFGYGKPIVEQSIAEETDFLREIVNGYEGKSFEPGLLFSKCTSDIMCSMLFGYKPSLSAEEDFNIVPAVDDFLKNRGGLWIFFPVLRHITKIPFVRNYTTLTKSLDSLNSVHDYIKKKIIDRKQTFDHFAESKDFIDAFLLEEKKAIDAGEPSEIFSVENLMHIVVNLFIAGTDTTATALTWGVLLVSAFDNVQKKVHEEIDKVIGRHRMPSMSDLDSMPYTRAVLSETLRFGAIAPLSLPHTATKDILLEDYLIPKDSFILANLYFVMRDPSHWKNPNNFDPNNFLDQTTGAYVPNDHFIPFSLGRRACLGEKLARMELFLFFVSLLQSHKIIFADNQKFDLDTILGGTGPEAIVRSPKEFYIRTELRE